MVAGEARVCPGCYGTGQQFRPIDNSLLRAVVCNACRGTKVHSLRNVLGVLTERVKGS